MVDVRKYCCVMAKTRVGSFDGTSRIRLDHGSFCITLFNQFGVPFTTSIKYCPWCGAKLERKAKVEEKRLDPPCDARAYAERHDFGNYDPDRF